MYIIVNLFVAQASPSVFTYFGQSNFAGKVIVLLLLVCSLIAWTVMIGKYMDMKKLKAFNAGLEGQLKGLPSIDRVVLKRHYGPYAILVGQAMHAYESAIASGSDSKQALAHIENALQREVAQLSARYEEKMVMLGSIVSGAPFLGLLGTVWGVMDAFGLMAYQSSASLQHLAPGVSGALLTTVAALLIAIPSVFGYNYLLSSIKQMILDLENFAGTLMDRLELEKGAAYNVS